MDGQDLANVNDIVILAQVPYRMTMFSVIAIEQKKSCKARLNIIFRQPQFTNLSVFRTILV
jgi:hypothetical protein